MQKTILLLTIALMIISAGFFACKGSKSPQNNTATGTVKPTTPSTPNTPPIAADLVVTLGSGGGVTGGYVQYEIYSDGKVNKIQTKPYKLTEMGNLTPKQIAKIQSELDALNMAELNINHPSSLTYFIRQHKKEIRWGNPNHTPPQNVLLFYDNTTNMLNTQ